MSIKDEIQVLSKRRRMISWYFKLNFIHFKVEGEGTTDMTEDITSISFELDFKCFFNHQMTKSQIKTLSLLGFFEIHFYSYFFVSFIIAKAISSILTFNLSLGIHRF